MQKFYLILAAGTLLLFTACSQNKDEAPQMQSQTPAVHNVVVEEVLQADSYTYLNVSENGKTFWIAVTKMEAQKGDQLNYTGGLEMRNFESKDLGRTFDVVYFVDSVNPGTAAAPAGMPTMGSAHPKPSTAKDETAAVTPAKGGITIGELYANKTKYNGKTVRIRGKVVKVNPQIMGRNWVHIQDGTSSGDKYDLTVATNENVNVGDVVTFEGVIALDKDFTAGYVYDVIMEQATVSVEQTS